MTYIDAPSTERPPMVARRKWTGARITGLMLMMLWAALALSIVYMLVDGYDPEKVAKYGPRILSGIWVTVKLVAISIVLGALISIPVVIGRLSHNPIIGGIAFGYSYFFRGTPLLAQTFLVYYGAGQFTDALKAVGLWVFFRDAYFCAIFTFSLNTAAYQAEILAGAIRAVPSGQWQAADSLGLRPFTTMFKVILPQALITALRPYGNEVILMIKGSAIASIITVLDLMGQTRYAFSKTYDLQIYIWAAVIYLITVEVLRRLWEMMERRLTRHLKR
ncbi:ABC transporter permease [Rhodopseudomonas palustris]|uniref:ABC transporter permease n=1 Tax=Rhodopseudomonas palustris TaxID=1076 RepID=UPI0009A4F1DA|nr:ABC transporter permease [Rhodopseudomonas palustris]OPF97141.1 amino acid ABC transporter permease [Rhodopseudomonas palustris]